MLPELLLLLLLFPSLLLVLPPPPNLGNTVLMYGQFNVASKSYLIDSAVPLSACSMSVGVEEDEDDDAAEFERGAAPTEVSQSLEGEDADVATTLDGGRGNSPANRAKYRLNVCVRGIAASTCAAVSDDTNEPSLTG